MTKFFYAFFAFVLMVSPMSAHADGHGGKQMAHAKPALYAVSMHAEWCGSCKIVQPKLAAARGKAGLDDSNILFVTLDLTDQTTRHQSQLLAETLGIGPLYQKNNGKTGYVALIDPKTNQEVARLTKDMSAGQMIDLLKQKAG